jgi:hypothetical protein
MRFHLRETDLVEAGLHLVQEINPHIVSSPNNFLIDY